MHKVSVSVPAVATNVGPGYDVLGLALNFRNVIEMSLRADDLLTVRCAASKTPCRELLQPSHAGRDPAVPAGAGPCRAGVRCTNTIRWMWV
jgi:hypothetical protein